MADSAVVVTAGTGTNIDTRTEGTNGNHRQVVVLGDPATNAGVAPVDATAGLKVDLGADNDVTVAGVSTAAKQDTIIGHLDGVETVLGTIDADTGNISTKIDTIAGAVSGTEMQVDIVSLPAVDTELTTADLDTGAGTDTRAVVGLVGSKSGGGEVIPGSATDGLLVNLGANNDVTVTSISAGDNNIGNVDIASIAAGDNNIGNVDIASAIPAGTNNIGDVDVLTVPADPFGANADAAATAGSTGSIQAKLRLLTSQLDAVKTAVETLDNAISGSEMQVDVVGALPAGTNAIGKLAANSGVDIGDVTLTAGTAAIGTLLPPDIDVTTHTNYAKKYYTNAGAVTDGIIWSPAAGKRWHVLSLFIQVSAAATVTLEDDKAGGDEVVMKMELAANSGISIPFPEKYPLASGEDAADLLITTSAGNVYVTAVGYEI